MNFLKRKPQQPGDGGEQLARTIANQIVRWQSLLAAKMNRAINRYSKQRQKWLLLIFCIASASGLVICLVLPLSSMPVQGNSYQPVHIGMPSDLPPKPHQLKTTDSLNTKK